jgi:hypothetical protein
MTVADEPGWVPSDDFRATLEVFRRLVASQVKVPKIQVQINKPPISPAALQSFTRGLRGLDPGAIREMQRTIIFLNLSAARATHSHVKWDAFVRPPTDLEKSLSLVKAWTDRYVADAANFVTDDARRSILDDLARSANAEPVVVESVYESAEQAAGEELESDEILAPVRNKRLVDLTPEQLDATKRFIDRWRGNFEFDLLILYPAFGEAYLFQVLQWAAVFAVIQVFLFAMIFPPSDGATSGLD